jgi:prevent-host-death family protein
MTLTRHQQCDHNGHERSVLKSANVSELKSRLSSYLADVQRGEEIIIRDRNRPIARIVPLTATGGEAEEAALVAAGVLRLPASEKLPAAFWTKRSSSIAEKRAARAVRRERDED